MSQAEELLNSLSAGDTTETAIEGHIVIGNDRFITVPEELKRIGVQYDHNIETVTFDCPRYWDGLDMSQMVIYINYMLPDRTKGCYIADNVTADDTDDTIMHFDWTISRNVTQVKGTIFFLVCIKKTDENDDEVNHWNSELCKDIYISEGLECSEPIAEAYPDIITSLLERMDAVEAYKVIDETLTKSGIPADSKTVGDKVNELQGEINNIVLSASDSGDVTAEVVQARVDANGTNHETLKARLDAMDATTDIISTASPKSLSLGTFEMGALTGNDGKPLSDTSTIRSGFVLVDGITKVKLSATSGYTFNLYQYKPDKTIVTTSYNYYSSEKEWILEENTKYIRVTLRKTSDITVDESSNLSALYSTELSDVNDRVGAVEASLVPDSINNELNNWTMGYLSSNNGSYNSSTTGSYYVTDLIPINGVAKLVTKATSDFKCKLFVYDASKTALRSQYNYYSGDRSWDAKNAVYFRIGITTTTERVISDVTEIENNVTVDSYSVVADLYDKATIKDYATDSCDLKGKIDITSGIDEFSELYENITGKTETFLFFSDCHIYTSQNIDGSDGMLAAIQKVHNSIPSKFVVDGGDILQNNDTKAVACAKLSKFSGKCRYLFDKCYHALGNHDTNYQGVDSTGTENTGILSNSAITALLFEEYGKNYYSFSGSNTKFWVLDSGTDWNNDIDQYRETQLLWLAEELANDNSENKAIITHIYFNGDAEHTFGLEIKEIVAAFNTRGTYGEISFANANGKIQFVLCGHKHVDMNGVIGGTTPVICIKKALSGNTYAFDAILIDYDADIINCVRFGDGDSRKFSLTTGELL